MQSRGLMAVHFKQKSTKLMVKTGSGIPLMNICNVHESHNETGMLVTALLFPIVTQQIIKK